MPSAWAINEDTGSPEYPAQEARRIAAHWLFAGVSDRFGARAGVRPGGGDVVTVSGTTWTVHDHTAVIYPGLTSVSGPYVAQVPGQSGSLNPADGSNPRIDALDLQVQDDDEDSSGERRVRVVYVPGTPAGSPTPEAVTPGSLRLATILVPAGGDPPSVQTLAPFTVASGGVLPVETASDLPASGTYDGMVAFDRETRQLVVADGPSSPTWEPAAKLPEEVWYTSSGTFQIADYPGARAVIAEPVGAGGGGGGAEDPATGQVAAGGGGAGGGYAKKLILASALSSSETVTRGTGGTGGSGSSSGGSGGTSSFGSHVSATGGGGGTGSAASPVRVIRSGGNGGVGSNGDVNIRGSDGEGAALLSGNFYTAGTGGAAAGPYGGGGGASRRTPSAGADGRPGGNYGGGGGGGHRRDSGSDQTGGDGANGLVVVTVLY